LYPYPVYRKSYVGPTVKHVDLYTWNIALPKIEKLIVKWVLYKTGTYICNHPLHAISFNVQGCHIPCIQINVFYGSWRRDG